MLFQQRYIIFSFLFLLLLNPIYSDLNYNRFDSKNNSNDSNNTNDNLTKAIDTNPSGSLNLNKKQKNSEIKYNDPKDHSVVIPNDNADTNTDGTADKNTAKETLKIVLNGVSKLSSLSNTILKLAKGTGLGIGKSIPDIVKDTVILAVEGGTLGAKVWIPGIVLGLVGGTAVGLVKSVYTATKNASKESAKEIKDDKI
ncbi:hypothetical protein K502DRAFT_347005 [Neoconidiobolus thromboides FSU 785]|nr:hypothetical protein K502DRAFT_347005 [Neoconidiobolus thromboides FSU 785]